MNNPASRGGPIVALALTPPYIPSQTYPIIHPVAQVGLSRLNYYADSKGLLVLFGPYLDQEPDETGRIYLNGLPVPTPAQTTVDKTSPLRFLVPSGMLSDGINNLKVRLQRQSGNEDSSELSVLHSLVAPAGNDPDPTPGNSLLNIDVTPKSIGPAEAAAGVKLTMSYLGMALYDLLTINYGGKTLTHQIVPTAQDPNPETKPVVLTFNTADFAHAPNNPQFIFKYNVISQIDDFSGTSSNGVFNPQEFWSKDCVVDLHLDWVELHEAILQEILGDNGDDPAIVDLGKMNGGPLWALIHLINTIWQVEDECDLTFEALVNGVVTATHQVKVPVSQVPGQLSVDIPNAKVIPDSTVRVTYTQIREGKVIGVSKEAKAQVIGSATTDVLEFIDAPYSVADQGRIKDFEVRLTRNGQPLTGAPILFTPPQGVVYADGSNDERSFTTDLNGIITLRDMRASGLPGDYLLKATSSTVVQTAVLTIKALGLLDTIPEGGDPHQGLALSPDDSRLYVATPNGVSVIDTASNSVIDRIPLSDVAAQLVVTGDGSLIFVAGHAGGTVSVLSSATHEIINTLPIGRSLIGLALNPAGPSVYVTDQTKNNLYEIDIATLEVIKTIPVSRAPMGIGFSPDGRQAVTTCAWETGADIIDVQVGKVTKKILFGSFPYGVDVSPDGRFAYVTDGGSGTLTVIDLKSYLVVRVVFVGPSTYGVKLSRDGTRIYIASRLGRKITVLDSKNFHEVMAWNLSSNPSWLAINHKGDRLYVNSYSPYRTLVFSI
ncbi:YncE family protein [Pseudomonas kribbensis]|uniref:YVTN family beta-propeller repeat protein n=1 Tax=Pseudomonas kribbensis TaxID=1628086 RepID=UPI003BF7D861